MIGPLPRADPHSFCQSGVGDGFGRGDGQDQVMGWPIPDPIPDGKPDPAEGSLHPAGDLAFLDHPGHPWTSLFNELNQPLKQLGFFRMSCEKVGQISIHHQTVPVSGR